MNNAPTYNERTTRALLNELTTNGGCTLQHDGVRARDGYAVGLGGAEALDPKRPYFVQVLRIVDRARKANAGTAFGAWHDSATGLDYVEPVEVLSCRLAATQVARVRGELAIFDLANNAEIRLQNPVTCGQCGHGFSHADALEQITCPACGFTSEPCDFPDAR